MRLERLVAPRAGTFTAPAAAADGTEWRFPVCEDEVGEPCSSGLEDDQLRHGPAH